jgi:hypothetical protein
VEKNAETQMWLLRILSLHEDKQVAEKEEKRRSRRRKVGEIRRNIFCIIKIEHHQCFKAVKLGPCKNNFIILKMYGTFEIATRQGIFNLLIYTLKMKPHKTG